MNSCASESSFFFLVRECKAMDEDAGSTRMRPHEDKMKRQGRKERTGNGKSGLEWPDETWWRAVTWGQEQDTQQHQAHFFPVSDPRPPRLLLHCLATLICNSDSKDDWRKKTHKKEICFWFTCISVENWFQPIWELHSGLFACYSVKTEACEEFIVFLDKPDLYRMAAWLMVQFSAMIQVSSPTEMEVKELNATTFRRNVKEKISLSNSRKQIIISLKTGIFLWVCQLM